MKSTKMIRFLEQNGFYLKRSSKHLIYTNGTIIVAVPHQKEIKSWTVNEILKHANLTHKRSELK